MGLSVRQIEAFRAVMLCGSTKAAADMLHVSQPVVSKLIAQLEQNLGYALFDRKANAILPNQAALKLFHEAKQVHERVERFTRFAKTLKQSPAGTLLVCSSATFATNIVPDLLVRYRKACPDVSVQIANYTVRDIAEKLIAEPDAIGITIWPVSHPDINCEVLAAQPVKVLMRADHRLARKRVPLKLDDLRHESLILHSDSMPLGDAIRDQLAQLPCEWRVPYTVDSSETAYVLVERGFGLSFCDGHAAARLRLRKLVSKDIDCGVNTYVCLLRSKFHTDEPHIDACMNLLRKFVSNL